MDIKWLTIQRIIILKINSMIRAFKIIILLHICLISLSIRAGEVITNTRLDGTALTSAGANLKVSYDKLLSLPYSSTNPLSLINASQGMLEFGIDETKKVFHATNFTSIVTISYFTKDFNLIASAPQVQTLEINYFPNLSYTGQSVFKIPNVSYIEITNISIQSYKDYGVPGSQVSISNPSDLYLESSIKVDETLSFDFSTSIPVYSNIGYNILPNTANPKDIEAWWGYLPGAEEYELEYIYIDDYDAAGYTSSKTTGSINYDFEHDATRIITHNQYYRIPLVYEKGYIVFRVRGVGHSQTNNNVRLEGSWSNVGYFSGNLLSFNSAFPNQSFHILVAHENDNINWASKRTFAENGKSGVGISYEDGLLKNRQSVAKLNTEDKTIVQASLYDWQGRPAISVLPTPFNDNFLSYKRDLNKTSLGAQFDKNIFDNSANFPNICNPMGLVMDPGNSTGAAKYYSGQNNTGLDAQQSYVPDAQGMPYVQVDYYPDQTGRIKRQSMPGGTHFLGSDKEHKFFYTQPTQTELVRLFGTEVGVYDEYEKQIDVDPNGQKTVTYTDSEGRTIASSLKGAAPSSLVSLDDASNPLTAQTDVATLVNNNNDPSNFIFGMTNNFFGSAGEKQQITYDVIVSQYTDACLPNMCLDCIYELVISLTDDCGQELLDGDLSVTGNQPVTKILGRYTPGGSPEFPTSCGNTSALHFSLSNPTPFSFNVTKDGTYHLSKTLKLSTKPLVEYANAFVQNNTCIKTLTDFQQQNLANIDISGCEMLNCAQCSTAVNSFIASLPAGTLNTQQQLDLLAKCDLKCNLEQNICQSKEMLLLKDFKPGGYFGKYDGSQINLLPTPDPGVAGTHSYSVSIFNSQNNIEPLIFNTTANSHKWFSNPPFSYGSYTAMDPTTSALVAPNLMSAVDYIGTHNDEYARPWLKWHPEYCRLQFNCDGLVNAINAYVKTLEGINSFDDACRLGYLYPLPSSVSLPNAPNASTCPSCSGITNQYNPLSNFAGTTYLSVSDLNSQLGQLTAMLASNTFLDQNNNPTPAYNIYQIGIGAGENNFAGIGSTTFGGGCNKDKEWLMYKRIYLSYVTNLMSNLQIDYISHWNSANGGCLQTTDFSRLPGYVRIFPDPSLTSTGTLAGIGYGASTTTGATAGSSAAVTTQCASYCHGYINSWISSLTNCSISTSDMPNVTAALEAVCSAGCDIQDPFGASNTNSPITITVAGSPVTVSTFQNVLDAYGYHFSASCNAYLINAPKPKGYSYSGSAVTSPTLDACGCDAILSAHTSYTSGIANNTINGCLVSETDYVNQQLHVTLPYLSSYVCACKAAKNVNGSGYDFSIITDPTYNLGMPLPLPPELACKHCINCNEIAKLPEILSNAFPGISFSSIDHTSLTNFLNGQFNMNNTYDEWVDFVNSCNQPHGLASISHNISPQALDFLNLMKTLYTNHMFVPNMSAAVPYYLNYANATSFFSSSIWAGQTLASGVTNPIVEVRVDPTPVLFNGLYYNTIYLTSNSTIPAYDLKIRIRQSDLLVLNSSENNANLTDIGELCRLQVDHAYNFFDIVGDVSGTPTLFFGYLLGNNAFAITQLQNNVPPNITQNPCSPYICSHSLQSNPPPPNNCLTIVINNALNAAQTQYNTYIAQQVDQFLDNYKNYCYNHVTETATRTYSINEYHYTLYYYDRAGNLVHTVPPAGVQVITNSTDITNAINYINNPLGSGVLPVYPLHSLNNANVSNGYAITSYISHNQYNTYDVPTTQVTPDGGETNYYYDHAGRFAVSQTSKQASENTYSYMLYDDLGRITEVGVFGFSTALGDVFSPNILKDPAAWKTFIGWHPKHEVTHTYYDTYLNTTVNAQFPSGQQNLRNRVTATTYEWYYDNNPDTYDYASFFSYDDHGHVNHIVQHNPELQVYNSANAFKHIEYEYELISGNVSKVIYQRDQRDQWFHKYEYDADNRLHTVYTSDNDLVYQRDAKYFYYQHGPMARTELGEKQVQGTDYAFTIQGWVKGVNSTILNENTDIGKDGAAGHKYMNSFNDIHKDFGKDAASYSLNYFNNDYNPLTTAAQNFLADMTNLNSSSATGFKLSADAPDLFNGNISSMVTSIIDINPVSSDNGKAKPQITGYQYDQLHRLKHMKAYSSMQIIGAHQSEAMDLVNNTWITPDATQNYSGVYEMDLTYDKMGNIKTLTRNGNAQYTSSWQAKQMDNLTYGYNSAIIPIASLGKNYTLNNRLTSVTDDASLSGNFGNDIDGTHTYDYNSVGSLQQDLTEEIDRIEWTDKRKVKSIIRISTSIKPDLYFGYDGLGRRISKTVVPKIGGAPDPLNAKTTHYVLDIEGQNIGIYEENASASRIKCVSRTIYGSGRLGENNQEVNMFTSTPIPVTNAIVFGKKEFELENHLDNVISTVSDRKLQVQGTSIDFYNDYEAPFNFQSSAYAFSGANSCYLSAPTQQFSPNMYTQVNVGDIVTASVKTYYTLPLPSGVTSPGILVISFVDANGNFLYDNTPPVSTTSPQNVQWFSAPASITPASWQSLTLSKTVPTLYVDLNHTIPYTGNIYVNSHIWNPNTNTLWVDDHHLQITPLSPIVAYYSPDISSTNDYYAFGMSMPGRSYNTYRYGHNGQEKDDEIFEGAMGAEYWEYDARIGRRWETDPVPNSSISPYACFGNNPILISDPNGDIPPVLGALVIGGIKALFNFVNQFVEAYSESASHAVLQPGHHNKLLSFKAALKKVDYADVLNAFLAGTVEGLFPMKAIGMTAVSIVESALNAIFDFHFGDQKYNKRARLKIAGSKRPWHEKSIGDGAKEFAGDLLGNLIGSIIKGLKESANILGDFLNLGGVSGPDEFRNNLSNFWNDLWTEAKDGLKSGSKGEVLDVTKDKIKHGFKNKIKWGFRIKHWWQNMKFHDRYHVNKRTRENNRRLRKKHRHDRHAERQRKRRFKRRNG